jgi:hypothetical protein
MPVLALLLLARPVLGQPPLFSVSVTPSERGFKYTIELKAERTVDVVVAASVYVPGRGWSNWTELWRGRIWAGETKVLSGREESEPVGFGSYVLHVKLYYYTASDFEVVGGEKYYADVDIVMPVESEKTQQLALQCASLNYTCSQLQSAYESLQVECSRAFNELREARVVAEASRFLLIVAGVAAAEGWRRALRREAKPPPPTAAGGAPAPAVSWEWREAGAGEPRGMPLAKVLALFAAGLLLALLASPLVLLILPPLAPLWVSAFAGFAASVAAFALGALLVVKGGKPLPLVLGMALTAFAAAAVMSNVWFHLSAYGLLKLLEEKAELEVTEHYAGVVGQPIRVGNWEIALVRVAEVEYVESEGDYYAAGEGEKVVVATLSVRNLGREVSRLGSSTFVLVTDAGRSYEDESVYRLNLLVNASEEVKGKAVKVRRLDAYQALAPGTGTEGDLLFLVPKGEKPVKLYVKLETGLLRAAQVEISLERG